MCARRLWGGAGAQPQRASIDTSGGESAAATPQVRRCTVRVSVVRCVDIVTCAPCRCPPGDLAAASARDGPVGIGNWELREWQAGVGLLAVLLSMARSQGDVNMMQQVEQPSGEQRGPQMNAQLCDAIPVVLLQPLTSEARCSAPLYSGPIRQIVAQGVAASSRASASWS